MTIPGSQVKDDALPLDDEAQPAGRSVLGRLVARLAGLGPALADQIYPPVCPVCDGPVATTVGLCASCWRALVPITPPCCAVLGTPLAVDLGPGTVSPEALAHPPAFDRARAAVVYERVARSLVSRFKYGDRPELADLVGRMMAAAGHEVLEGDGVLVPVPLHFWRQVGRRYNQAEALAAAVGGLANRPVDANLLVRTRRTRQQVGLSSRQRRDNVAGAFAVRAAARERVAGRRFVLVDDVLTTGATVGAAATALRRAGAAGVDVLTFARVVTGAPETL